jgi:D-xylose transport system permease protein
MLFLILMNRAGGVPLPLVLLLVVAGLTHVALEWTVWGRHLYAIGGNEVAARLAGVGVAAVTTGAFVALGVVTALAGFLQTAYVGVTTTSTGEYMELDAIAACVVGGTSLRGGRGSVMGVLFGSLLIASLSNGMNMLSVEPYLKLVVLGFVLMLAVYVDNRAGSGQRN